MMAEARSDEKKMPWSFIVARVCSPGVAGDDGGVADEAAAGSGAVGTGAPAVVGFPTCGAESCGLGATALAAVCDGVIRFVAGRGCWGRSPSGLPGKEAAPL
jgi:hypothetical protein